MTATMMEIMNVYPSEGDADVCEKSVDFPKPLGIPEWEGRIERAERTHRFCIFRGRTLNGDLFVSQHTCS